MNMGQPMRGGHRHGRGDDSGREGEGPPPLSITDKRMLGWFYTNLGPHWHKILLGVLTMTGSTWAGLYQPKLLRDIFDKVIGHGQTNLLYPLAAALMMWTILGGVLGARLASDVLMPALERRLEAPRSRDDDDDDDDDE